MCREAGAEVMVHETNQGKGRAIQTGLRALTERGVDFVLILDADGQHLPEEIPRFLAAAAERPGERMFLGNRMHHVEDMPKNRLYTNRFMSGRSACCADSTSRTRSAGFG